MSLNKTDPKRGYEFSENQKNLWLLGSTELEVFYHQVVLEFDKDLPSEEKLKQVVAQLVANNEALRLRTQISKNYTFPIQVYSEITELDFTVVSYQNVLDEEVLLKAREKIDEAYNSEKNAPIRCVALKRKGVITRLYVRLFALWGDSYSLLHFCNQLATGLATTLADEPPQTEKIAYLNYTAWQNELIATPEEEAVQFWKLYAPIIDKNSLPFFNEGGQNYKFIKRDIGVIEGEEYFKLKEFCTMQECTLEEIFLNQWLDYIALFEEDITIGYLPFRRGYQELNDTLGYINKLLPLNFRLSSNASRMESVKKIQGELEKINGWADYFSTNREDVKKVKNQIFNNSFDFVSLKDVFENGALERLQITDFYHVQDPFELKLSCLDFGNGVEISLYLDSHKITENSQRIIQAQLVEHFKKMTATNGEENRLSLPEQNLLEDLNATKSKEISNLTVLDAFAQSVASRPNDVALIYGDTTLTYLALDKKSNQFANTLLNNAEISQQTPICILMEPSQWMIISILGVLKAGCYYVPIDENYPKDRIHFILEDCKSKILITNRQNAGKDFPKIAVISPIDDKISEEKDTFNTNITPDHSAYCIYTSGSTGKPKGCLISHKNIYNYIHWANTYYFGDASHTGNFALLTSIAFDLTVTSIFSTLTRGKTLTILGQSDIVTSLKASFCTPNVDTLKITPAHISLLKELNLNNQYIKNIICGGEQLTKAQVDIIQEMDAGIRLFNEYGPTEATVGCVVKEIDKNDDHPILIGRPISNTTLRIIDTKGYECPIGVIGELVIYGLGVTQGYLNRDELTKERFVNSGPNGQLGYKTGDLVRCLPCGNIEYIGRIDDQVKFNGFRIELNEITSLLKLMDGIDDAVVLILEEGEKREMVAFIQMAQEVSHDTIREYLQNTLPDYMIPSSFIKIDHIPLTINGKVDKNHLIYLKNNTAAMGVPYVAPTTSIEKRLASLWEEVLQIERVGIEDNFFNIGGDSIKAVRIVTQIQKEFEINMDIATLFKDSTIKALAEEIENHNWYQDELKDDDIVDKTTI